MQATILLFASDQLGQLEPWQKPIRKQARAAPAGAAFSLSGGVSLDVVGDRWTLLVIRDLLLGSLVSGFHRLT